MSSERRAATGDEVGKGTAALSTWLTDTLRPPRAEDVEPAATTAPADPAEAVEATLPEPAADDSAEPSPASEISGDENGVVESRPEPPAFDPTAIVPPVPPIDEPGPELEEPDPSLLFLAQEQRVRRAQRTMFTAVAVGLLLLGGAYFLSRRASDAPADPADELATTTPPAAPPAAAKPLAPTKQDFDPSESEPEELEPATKAGLRTAIGLPVLPSPSSDPAVIGGPSTARYPDLPRDVLIQLEQAAETAAPVAP